jgi:hypothetical protein
MMHVQERDCQCTAWTALQCSLGVLHPPANMGVTGIGLTLLAGVSLSFVDCALDASPAKWLLKQMDSMLLPVPMEQPTPVTNMKCGEMQ